MSVTGTVTTSVRLPSAADTSYASIVPACSRVTRKRTTARYAPRHPVPQAAVVKVVPTSRPAASSTRTLTVASNTSAVPVTVTGVVTRAPIVGPVTTIAFGWLGLEAHAQERCEGFSKGMRQKVALAGALVHEPRLIILDEPLTGLDAGSARQVKEVLRERVRAGSTVIMTTHILEVAERMADRIGVIAGGRLIAEGTLEELRRQAGKSGSSLEDTFLALVGQDAAAA